VHSRPRLLSSLCLLIVALLPLSCGAQPPPAAAQPTHIECAFGPRGEITTWLLARPANLQESERLRADAFAEGKLLTDGTWYPMASPENVIRFPDEGKLPAGASGLAYAELTAPVEQTCSLLAGFGGDGRLWVDGLLVADEKEQMPGWFTRAYVDVTLTPDVPHRLVIEIDSSSPLFYCIARHQKGGARRPTAAVRRSPVASNSVAHSLALQSLSLSVGDEGLAP